MAHDPIAAFSAIKSASYQIHALAGQSNSASHAAPLI
jgi:hypothetical protein